MKKVYLAHVPFKLHSSTKLMIDNPPQGYVFVLNEDKIKRGLFKFVFNLKFVKFLYRKVFRRFFIKSGVNAYNLISSAKIGDDADLILSGVPLTEKRPWVLEILDHPAGLAGNNYQLFMRNKKNMEETLLSPFCKKIIVVNESSYRLIRKYFDKKVLRKTILIRAAVKEQNFKKEYDKKQIQIIFIGSVANPDDFYIKGGLEAIETYSKISRKYNNVKFIVRSKVPEEVKAKYKNVKNLEIVERELSHEEWVNMLKQSDICLNLGHIYPLMASLESMSYGIPVIMLDTFGVRDYLINGKNAILIKPSQKISGYKSKEYPLNVRSKEFIEEIKEIDEKVIIESANALEKLIKDYKLRKKFGEYSRSLVKTKFSLKKRNFELKKVFDEAINLKEN